VSAKTEKTDMKAGVVVETKFYSIEKRTDERGVSWYSVIEGKYDSTGKVVSKKILHAEDTMGFAREHFFSHMKRQAMKGEL